MRKQAENAPALPANQPVPPTPSANAPIVKVIFRIYPESQGGEVIALFPEDASSTSSYYRCTAFVHMGGHTDCDPWDVIKSTRLATPEEYAEIKLELERAPYRYSLQVCKRQSLSMVNARKADFERFTALSR